MRILYKSAWAVDQERTSISIQYWYITSIYNPSIKHLKVLIKYNQFFSQCLWTYHVMQKRVLVINQHWLLINGKHIHQGNNEVDYLRILIQSNISQISNVFHALAQTFNRFFSDPRIYISLDFHVRISLQSNIVKYLNSLRKDWHVEIHFRSFRKVYMSLYPCHLDIPILYQTHISTFWICLFAINQHQLLVNGTQTYPLMYVHNPRISIQSHVSQTFNGLETLTWTFNCNLEWSASATCQWQANISINPWCAPSAHIYSIKNM